MEKTLLGLGIACIIAAIVGGGFKGLGVEIPIIATARRQLMLGALGSALVLTQQYDQWKERHPTGDPAALVESGLESYDSGDFRSAAQELKQAAELSNAEAQYHYGEMLYHGEGLIPDTAEAAEWILKSAEQGYPPGEASAAMLALQQANPDTARARMWARRSAIQNDPVGLFFSAALEPDSTKRTELLIRSADGGYAPSQLLVGMNSMVNAKKSKRPIGTLSGIEWIKRAAKQGDETAELLMARFSLSLAMGDTTMPAVAYVWWTRAQQPHKAHFAALPEIRVGAASVGDSIEAHLSLLKQLEARKMAIEERDWQPKLERLYRHGH